MKSVFYYYSNLKGKANRKEFGIYLLIEIIIGFIALELASKISINEYETLIYLFYINLIIGFSTVPFLAVCTRRLNFLNYPSYLIFLIVIPFINQIFAILLLFIKKRKK